MMRPFNSLRGQLILLIVAALLVAQAISLWLFVDERSLAIRAALGFEAAGRAANVVRLIEQAPPELHASILRAADSPLVRFSLEEVPSVTHLEHDDSGRIERHVRTLLQEHEDREIRVELHQIEGQILPLPMLSEEMAELHRAMMRGELSAIEMNLSIALSDDRWLNVGTRFERPPLQWPLLSALTFGITAAIILSAVFYFLLTRVTGPLRRLSRAADRLGRGEHADPLPVIGPDEIRDLTTTFNRMQERLTRFVSDRTRILAAVSHDLRSPLTALRVRAEMVDDDETRESLVESIEEMQQMAEATLTFAKGVTGREEPQTVDIGLLLHDLSAIDPDRVTCGDGPSVAIRIRPLAIRRALRNLIENALRYGGLAHVEWWRDAPDLVISITDTGPGIPEADLSKVFDPFYRIETSRSLETGGHGLGLSIARSILRAHGGDIELHNTPGGGLTAQLRVPLASEDEPPQTQTEAEDETHDAVGGTSDHDGDVRMGRRPRGLEREV